MTVDVIAAALVELSIGEHDAAQVRLASVDGRLARALVDGLQSGSSDGVYVQPAAFERFIGSPPNARLYADVEKALASWVAEGAGDVRRVFDVGCGDGRVTAAVCPGDLQRVELIEPSAALLDSATVRLFDYPVVRIERTVAAWLGSSAGERRDVGWSTFALHNLPPDERAATLEGIAERTDRFAVVEFDVPEWRSLEQWGIHCAERYAIGAAAHNDAEVLHGFLVPVLLGQFAPDAVRHTYEQPLAAWEADFQAAGFTQTEVQEIHSDFWWASAGMVTGISER